MPYDPDFSIHLVPIVAVAGLERDESLRQLPEHPLVKQGERINGLGPVQTSDLARDIRSRLAAKSQPLTQWLPAASYQSKKQPPHLVNIQFVGQDLVLPPVKSLGSVRRYPNGSAHSLLSPRTPGSPLYPDKVIGVEWLQKYLYITPQTVISVHALGRAVDDEDLSTRLSDLKRQLDHRDIKLIAVILFDGDPKSDSADQLNDRIYNLRRATGLAPRTGLFFLPHATDVEKETLVETLCQLTFAQGQDFATSLSKDLRRKRNKNNVQAQEPEDESEPTGLSTPPLPNVGWELRYNFKLAVMAEYRQELDVALTMYEAAYDSTLELFETIQLPSKEESQKLESASAIQERWCQARMLLDVCAFKIAKLCLYTDQANNSYRKFIIHLDSVTALIGKKGLSSNAFAYNNWLAHQYLRMADLVALTGDATIARDEAMIKVEHTASFNDELPPIMRLPRAGFLYLDAFRLLQKCLSDDGARLERDADPYFSGDTDVQSQCVEILHNALKDFSVSPNAPAGTPAEAPKKHRTIGFIYFELANLAISTKSYEQALEYYKQSAEVYRNDKWAHLLALSLKGIIEVSGLIGSSSSLMDRACCQLELLTLDDASEFDNKVLDDTAKSEETPVVSNSERPINLFQGRFAFETDECYTGRHVSSQLTLTPLFKCSEFAVSEIRVDMKGDGLGTITITHDASLPASDFIVVSGTEATANLVFAKNKAKVFQLSHTPRSVGQAEVSGVLVYAREYSSFSYQQLVSVDSYRITIPWVHLQSDDSSKTRIRHIRVGGGVSYRTKVHPRPSQLTIKTTAPADAACGENLYLSYSVKNDEEEQIFLQADAKCTYDDDASVPIEWIKGTSDGSAEQVDAGATSTHELKVIVPNSGVTSLSLEIFVSYYLESDTDTVVKEVVTTSLPVSRPFRFNFDVAPRLHPDPWQNIFVPVETSTTAVHNPDIRKRWALLASALYLGSGKAEVTGTTLEIASSTDDTACEVSAESAKKAESAVLIHNDGFKRQYIFDCYRLESKEVRTVAAEAHLKVTWRRVNENGDKSEESTYAVAPLRLHLPLHEPRVIVSVSVDGVKVQCDYYIENATSHILTYAVNMASSADFGWQGMKSTTVRMLPFTRRQLTYHLMALGEVTVARLLRLPALSVYDTFYKRVLPVITVTNGVVQEKSDLLVQVGGDKPETEKSEA